MRRTIFILSILIGAATTQAQTLCEPIADRCERHITREYIPDGQFYRALLQGDEVAEFGLTLFGGTTYRVAACSGESDGILVFSVYDKEHTLLFTNSEYQNSPYWDFVLASTMDVTIEAMLDPTMANSGCAVMLMGFKK